MLKLIKKSLNGQIKKLLEKLRQHIFSNIEIGTPVIIRFPLFKLDFNDSKLNSVF